MGCLLVLILLFLILYYKAGQHSNRWLFGGAVYLFFFVSGIGITATRLSQVHYKWEKNKTFYEVVLTDTPREKPKSIACTVNVLSVTDSISKTPVNRKALLYLSKDSLNGTLKYGDRLMLYVKIASPDSRSNPEEVDYATYLVRKGIAGTGFVGSGHWKLLGRTSIASFGQKAEIYRTQAIDYYRHLGFEGDEQSVLSALTLGYKEDLSEEVKEAYSTSGVSHLLALSGLHIGIICTLFAGLLCWTNRSRVLFISGHLFVIVLLWGYACFTGFSPSVVRSVIMFSLLILARMGKTEGMTLNVLAVAACLMLLWNPFYLFDVSFQLSFVAVASIVVIQPFLYKQLKVKSGIGQYIWGVTTVTIAAQIGTCPIVMYYFSSFPVYFLLTNLFAIPWVFAIMYVTVGMLLLSAVPVIQSYVVNVVGWMIGLLNQWTEYIGNLPYSSIRHLWVTPVDIAVFYFVILLIALYVVRKYRKAMLYAGVTILLLCFYHTTCQFMDRSGASIIFYDNTACPAVHFINSRKSSYLVSVGDEKAIKRMQKSYQRYWDSRQMDFPLLIATDQNVPGIWRNNDIVHFRKKTVCLLTDSRWRNKTADKPLLIDYLYVCKGYRGRLAELKTLFTIKKVILDSSLNTGRLTELKDECRLLGLDFISISEKGSLYIDL